MEARRRRREPGDGRRACSGDLDEAVGDGELSVRLEIEAEIHVDARPGPDARVVRSPASQPVIDDDFAFVAPGNEPPGDRDVATAAAGNRGISKHERFTAVPHIPDKDSQRLPLAVELDVRRDAVIERDRVPKRRH